MRFNLFPRAHLTLIGFNKNGYRKFGGVGFSFSNPNIQLEIFESKSNNIAYFLNGQEINYNTDRLLNVLNSLCKEFDFKTKVYCKIDTQCPPHSGFGTGTNISLACIEALLTLNNIEFDNEKLIKLSNRGRTSGIGIQTYFKGGFVMDIGVKNYDNVFLPSNNNNSKNISKPLLHINMPEWNFLVCIPKKIKPLSTEEETAFFIHNTPLENSDVENILYVTIYGLCSSLIEGDFYAFCKSINDIQLTKWKCLERTNFSEALFKLESKIFDCGANAVGMSSLGPSLIVLSDNIDLVQQNLKAHQEEIFIIKTQTNNLGRVIYG